MAKYKNCLLAMPVIFMPSMAGAQAKSDNAPRKYAVCLEDAAEDFAADCYSLIDTVTAAEGVCQSEKLEAYWYHAKRDQTTPPEYSLADKFVELERSRAAAMILLQRRANPELCPAIKR
ncbi:hypothetical protein [Jiella marina]|uniref:hypothetical protein n=1 Tax=Jiella sp. LLJ827 TaxID=2917712 RepID=UPI00210118F0|nr:hypothetical protein [Jiella sp. LLJ827]MCQ0989064.1 hypothetical protein [Jiella sp. LLJ827]